jgi:2-keto-4-pentenoate hydratase
MMSDSGNSARELIARGMAAQLARLRASIAAGAPRAGWKIGLNDPAVQRRFGLDSSLVAALDGRFLLRSGESYRGSSGALLMAEAEVAVQLTRDLVGDPTEDSVREALGRVAPAIELVDYNRPARGLAEILEHGVFHAATVLGADRSLELPLAIEPGLPVLRRNGEVVANPDPALDPGDPVRVVLDAARFLARHGESLRGGDWIITGSRVQPVEVESGDRIEADFGALGTAGVMIAF